MRLQRSFLVGMALAGCSASHAFASVSVETSLASLMAQCAPEVHPQTLRAIATVESGFNPFAIGVVGGRLAHQPQSLGEAVATAQDLQRRGYNFSLGLMQVNVHNLHRFHQSISSVFAPCANLQVGAAILKDCFVRASRTVPHRQAALRAALSCYYSGDFSTGFRQGYVERVADAAQSEAKPIPVIPAAPAPRSSPAHPTRAAGVPAPQSWVTVTPEAPEAGQRQQRTAAVAVAGVRRVTAINALSRHARTGFLSDAISGERRSPGKPAAAPQSSGLDGTPPFVEIIQ